MTSTPSHLSIPGMVALVAENRPATIAVRTPDRDWRYDLLWHLSGAMAARFPDTMPLCPVAFTARRGIGAVVTMLACLRAGRAYVPISSSLGAAARSVALDAIGHCVDLTGSDLDAEVEALAAGTPDPLDSRPSSAKDDSPVQRQDLRHQRPAYVMLTSGSTGIPKPVCVSQTSVLNLVLAMSRLIPEQNLRVLHAAPLPFDASTFELWFSLCNGHTLLCVPERDTLDYVGLVHFLQHHRPDCAWLTSALLDAITAHDGHSLASLRCLLTGGDVVSGPTLERLRQLSPGLRIFNGYGPTECTTFASIYEVPSRLPTSDVPIGFPLDNTDVMVLDTQLQPLPAHVIGDLYVAGEGLAYGYLGSARQTATSFIANPHGPAGARMYRTGDLGFRDEAGRLHFGGRRDRQIKLNGHRIELDEVESVLAATPGVRGVAAFTLRQGDKVTAIVAAIAGDAAALAQAQSRCYQQLPAYAVPSRWRVVEQLPLTTNGKLDRAAVERSLAEVQLPDSSPTASADARAVPHAANDAHPQTQAVRAIWRQELGADCDPAKSFYAAGGDSITAVKVAAAVRRQLGIRVSQRDVTGAGDLDSFVDLCIRQLLEKAH
ncbi:amino acid adenylation domain-containing protein [Roseateles sp. YR242]|uniref:non-ribosomal peptide synthetase n=1 Tax=Roseateles sp. YR242 TaxID=1855305 RepID=UPI0008BB3E2B|nr:non-ribosomal peptide synthetase [Roseateles sp. YR242]SEL52338.1 amino acid adenylation domain-containing protein [Roseateles sp. YR242]